MNNTDIYNCFLSLSEGHIPVVSGSGEGMRNRQLKINKLCDMMEMTNALKLWDRLSGIQISHKYQGFWSCRRWDLTKDFRKTGDVSEKHP